MVSYCYAADDDELLSEMGAASGRFWRLRLPDGFICRKMELYDDAGKAVVVFTQGRSGNYAMAMGKWGRMSEILPLWYFDDMAGALTTLRLAWPASRSGPSITKTATPGKSERKPQGTLPA